MAQATPDTPDPVHAPELSVVIPVHNEVDNIKPLVEKLSAVLQSYNPSYEIIFVDDGSTDGTFDAIKALHDIDSRTRVVRFTRNYGQTPALAAGLAHPQGEPAVAMGGELENSDRDLPSLRG